MLIRSRAVAPHLASTLILLLTAIPSSEGKSEWIVGERGLSCTQVCTMYQKACDAFSIAFQNEVRNYGQIRNIAEQLSAIVPGPIQDIRYRTCFVEVCPAWSYPYNVDQDPLDPTFYYLESQNGMISDCDSSAQNSSRLCWCTAPGAGGDPIAKFGNVHKKFFLAVGQLMPLLRGPGVVIFATVFEGTDGGTQFFDRFMIANAENQEEVLITIKTNIAPFNSTTPRGTLQTIDISLDGKPLPSAPLVRGRTAISADGKFRVRVAKIEHRKIGTANQETIEVATASMTFLFKSQPPCTYMYDKDSESAVKDAHLDFEVPELGNIELLEGLLPELWGLKEMSQESVAQVENPSAVCEECLEEERREIARQIGRRGDSASESANEIYG